uniref:HDC03502 n=1 Tax=Drosophila melanogaster TaxID=7227 RepID=Q6IH30_DROME|nr:TPA_inf: HDC03502 [Drosophila melanogaster]
MDDSLWESWAKNWKWGCCPIACRINNSAKRLPTEIGGGSAIFQRYPPTASNAAGNYGLAATPSEYDGMRFISGTIMDWETSAVLRCWRCSTDVSNGEFCNDPFMPETISEQQRYWSYVNCTYSVGAKSVNARPVCKKLVQEGEIEPPHLWRLHTRVWHIKHSIFLSVGSGGSLDRRNSHPAVAESRTRLKFIALTRFKQVQATMQQQCQRNELDLQLQLPLLLGVWWGRGRWCLGGATTTTTTTTTVTTSGDILARNCMCR